MVCTEYNYITYFTLPPYHKNMGEGGQMNNNNERLPTIKCTSCCVAEEYSGFTNVNTCVLLMICFKATCLDNYLQATKIVKSQYTIALLGVNN